MKNLDLLIWLIPALPLAAAIVTAVLGRRVLRGMSHIPVVLALAGSLAASCVLLNEVRMRSADDTASTVGYEHITRSLWTWAAIDQADVRLATSAAGQTVARSFPLRIDWVLRADPLTAMMLVMVTFVSLLVAIYAAGYMHGDAGYWRFFAYIALFVFSMTMLVSVSNFVLLYVFWEAVGVCSYLLIGFWYEKPEAAAAGKKAFLVNRIGDFAFALGVFLIWTTFHTADFHDSAGAVPGVLGQRILQHGYSSTVGDGVAMLICLLLFVGACGKSAQFPLHVWLPDAMEGPTPVSALIHAATMVTAGVYMVARCAPLFVIRDTQSAHFYVATIGALTAFLAAVIALTQTDLKRVLAYSTVSQLGYMFLALGTMTVTGVIAGMFHLLTHAFFKALLFLGAGSVMHAMGGVIDFRYFSGLRRRLPVTHVTFLVGSLALAGFPLLAGFWSKDGILAAVYDKANDATDPANAHIYWPLLGLATVTAAMTAFYTFRAYFRTFHGEERIPHEAGHHAHESPRSMTVPLMILAVFAAAGGAFTLLYPQFLVRTPSLAFLNGNSIHLAEAHFHWNIAGVSSAVALAGIGLAWVLYVSAPSLVERLTGSMRSAYLYQLSHGKLFLDQIYYVFIVWPLKIAAFVLRFLDNFLVDGCVNLVGVVPGLIGALLRPLQIGLVQFYALAMMLGLVVLLGSLLWWY